MKALKTVASLAVALAFAGCTTLAPEYTRQAPPVENEWAGAGAPNAVSNVNAIPDLQWQQLFADAKLREIVQRALDNNRDLRVAALNVEKAQAQHRIQRSQSLPEVGASASQNAQRMPDDVAPLGEGGVTHVYGASVGVSAYELDLFGRVRSLNEEALQSYFATEETRRAVHIGLVSQVAQTYLAIAADRALEELARQTLASRERALEIQQQRLANGASSRLELRQAQAEVEDARTRWLEASRQTELDRNALDLLAGAKVPDTLLPNADALQNALAVQDIPAGLPSDLLQNRPDILAAEHRLMGAHANIGAARAAFFPSISLTASAGTASNALSSLFSAGTAAWSFAPVINMPIFTGGRLQAQLDVSKIRKDVAVAEYERSIQSAFREVADQLATRRVIADQETARTRQADAAQAAREMVDTRYRNGVMGYLDVLDAQRTEYAARASLIGVQLARQASVVGLYKALGGGWQGGGIEPGETHAAARVAANQTEEQD
jgi:outer membrane protein, multidrug efflux system